VYWVEAACRYTTVIAGRKGHQEDFVFERGRNHWNQSGPSGQVNDLSASVRSIRQHY
jgi:hypothetical protein